MKLFVFLSLILICQRVFGQESTFVSLFLKADKGAFLNELQSDSGNMFHKVGHHGPAVENQWFALRIYFDKREAIDVYSKPNPGMELRQTRWYPTKEQQKNGSGADYYRVGNTVGLGGIKLWDGNKVVPLNPVSKRIAKVAKGMDFSTMGMLSEEIPFKGKKLDICVRVTVFSDSRKAKVEAFTQSREEVQFVTGINYHKGIQVIKGKNYIATWGIHPEDVAAEKVAVVGALIYDEQDFIRQFDDGKQILFISKPTKHLQTWIISANAREPEINNLIKFTEYLNDNR
ncbi:MAG TPA: DUF4861 domain-containing protein [Marinilabiliales bacterium]|nr:DUF4861 domain-containing protein [Marinilabiliales bacterium]